MMPLIIPVRIVPLAVSAEPGDTWSAQVTVRHKGPEVRVKVRVQVTPLDLPSDIQPLLTTWDDSSYHTFEASTDWNEHTFTGLSAQFPSTSLFWSLNLSGTIYFDGIVSIMDEAGNVLYSEIFEDVYTVSVPPFSHEWSVDVSWS